MKRILNAAEQLRRAERTLVLAVQKSATPGTIVRWNMGSNQVRGFVIEVSEHHPRLRVQNSDTHKVYWIESWQLVSIGS